MTSPKFIGQPIPRIEDKALITGAGRFVDDIHLPGMLEAAFVRSTLAHARIGSIDVSAARAAPGVHAVLTYADIRPLLTQDRLPLELRLEPLPPNITPYPLAKDEVVFVGEAIVVVIADSRYLAEDAATLVEVEYDPLPAVSDCARAIEPGAPRADTRKASNIVKEFRQTYGNVDAAFNGAPHRAALRLKTHRGVGHAIEGRAVLANYDAIEDRLTVWDSTQESHDVRGLLMTLLDLNENQIRVIAPDVGGGFGAKHLMYPEEVVIAAVSRKLRRPVKWIEDRREHFLSSIHERDQYWDMDIAFDDDGRLLGHARAHDPRPRCVYAARNQSADQRIDGAAGALSRSRSRPPGDRGGNQQGRDHSDSRCGLPVGEFRHGALARLHRARSQARSRRSAPAQSYPAGEDAVQYRAGRPLRLADRL